MKTKPRTEPVAQQPYEEDDMPERQVAKYTQGRFNCKTVTVYSIAIGLSAAIAAIDAYCLYHELKDIYYGK